MTTKTTSTNPLAEQLKGIGITSGRKLAQHTQARAVIFFLAKDDQGKDYPRAELHYGREKVTFLPKGMDAEAPLGAMRRKTVESAQAAAAELLGLEVWHKTPFSNCWLPAEAINRMRAELGTDPIV